MDASKLKDTKLGSKNRTVREIGEKLAMLDWGEGNDFRVMLSGGSKKRGFEKSIQLNKLSSQGKTPSENVEVRMHLNNKKPPYCFEKFPHTVDLRSEDPFITTWIEWLFHRKVSVSSQKKRETRFLSGVQNWSATVRRVRLERLKVETTAGRGGSQQAANPKWRTNFTYQRVCRCPKYFVCATLSAQGAILTSHHCVFYQSVSFRFSGNSLALWFIISRSVCFVDTVLFVSHIKPPLLS